MNGRNFLKLTAVFLVTRGLLFALSYVAHRFLAYDPSFPYATTLLPSFHVPQWVYSFANFDGVHYLTIAQHGYTEINFIQAFFPLLPYILLHLPLLTLGSLFNPLVVGLLITNSAFLAFICLWFSFVHDEHNEKVAWYSTLVYMLFPTSFFFGALYTESLFMLFVVLCLWFARKKYWLFVGICITLACLTRIIGVFLIPMLLWELYIHYVQKAKKRDLQSFLFSELKNIIFILLGVSGLLGYMLFLWKQFGDPLYFFHVQSSFGAGRQTNIVLYPQVVFRYIKIFLTVPLFAIKSYAYVQEAFVSTVGFVLLLISYTRVKLSYLLFAVPAFLLPTLTGNFSSMPRYVLVCFPLFLWAGIVLSEHKKIAIVWYVLSTLLLVWNTLLFIQGYWVA